MSEQSYSKGFLVSKKPSVVYKAITEQIDKWWTELSNKASKVGDNLIVKFEKETTWVMKVSEAIPHQSLVWKVTEANHDLEDILIQNEWKGTTIKWEIEENETGSKVSFMHEGLVSSLECYALCERGWHYFLESLKNYLDTGKGNPFIANLTNKTKKDL